METTRPIRAGALCAAMLALVAGVSGCATMTEEQCLKANWSALGLADGRNGEMPEHGSKRLQACSEKGITGNLAAWRTGWEQGRREVCAPGNAANWAQRDGEYTRGFCPPEMEPAFLSAYAPVRERVRFERHIRDLERQVDDRSRQLSDVIRQMGRPENQPREKQAQLAARKSSLEHEIRSLRERIRTDTMLRATR